MADDKKVRFKANVAIMPTNVDHSSSAVGSEPTVDNRKELTTGYYAVITPDSVASFLPYYDKTTTEGVGVDSRNVTQDNPTRSLDKEYGYSVKQNKKGHVIATISLSDSSKISKYVFDLAPDGTAKVEATIGGYKIMTYEGTYTAL
jgi:hypothetical protein